MKSPEQEVDVDPLTAVQQLYAAFGAADETRLRSLIAPDVEWIQCEGFPGGEHHLGIDSVLAGVLHGNRSTWTDFGIDIEEYLPSGNRIVVLGSYTGAHCDTGKTMRSVFSHVYDVDCGRITRFRQYCDTWPMVRAMS